MGDTHFFAEEVYSAIHMPSQMVACSPEEDSFAVLLWPAVCACMCVYEKACSSTAVKRPQPSSRVVEVVVLQ